MAQTTNHQQLNRLDVPTPWTQQQDDTNPDSTQDWEDPKNTTSWTTITDPPAIERYLLMRNCHHFGQAQGTPFTIPPLNTELDWGAASQASQAVLDGQYIAHDQKHNLCKQLLQECKIARPESMPAEISYREFANKIKVWDENTTTSPSGGRYKALFAKSAYPINSIEQDAFIQQQQDIAELIINIINFCINSGYPIKRWRKITNTMIFKTAGNYQIHRLRVIHIFEADLNLVYAVKWRALLYNAERHALINRGQYGGRPGYEASSLALTEELRLDIAYTTRRTLITFDNDASACYDRMIPNLVSLTNRRFGLHAALTYLHGTILSNTNYHIQTAAGLSTHSHSHSNHTPLYGTGQGASNSPTIWLLISSLLFDIYDRNCHGALFCSSDGNKKIRLGISGFVDDTNVIVNSSHPQSEPNIHSLLQKMQEDAQVWCNQLHISLNNCSYHTLQFDFKPDGTPIIPHQATLPPLMLQDPTTHQTSMIPCLPATRVHKILGHWKSPADKQQREQLKALTMKAHQHAILISTSPVTRGGAKLAYNGKYIASLRSVLPQCWFSAQQLHKAQRSSMAKIVQKCGFAKTTPHAILYAPEELAGGGFIHWNCVSWAQWQAGIGTSILYDVHTPLPHLESRWLPSLRTFLSTIQGQIHLDNTYVPPIERQGDSHIMDFVLQCGHFTETETKHLNYCRQYLHVATISELFNARGTQMLSHMYECQRPPGFNKETYVIRQNQPSRYQRKHQWQRFCRMLCHTNLQAKWFISLAAWQQEPTGNLPLRREAYIDTQKGVVHAWRDGRYWEALPHHSLINQYYAATPTTWQPHDNHITPIDIVQYHSPRRFTVSHRQNHTYTPKPTTPPIKDFAEYVTTFEQWEQELLGNINRNTQPYELMHRLEKWGTDEVLLVVSDGSSLEHHSMSFGVVVGDKQGSIMVEAYGQATGDTTSHRAECTGCLAGALLLKHLQEYTSILIPPHIQLEIVSDNQGMITSLNDRMTYTTVCPNATLQPDWDILEETHQTYTQVGTTNQTYKWVKGQDDNGKAKLSVEANYNIRADYLANHVPHMTYPNDTRIMRDQYPTPMRHYTRCILYIDDKARHGHYTATIRRAAALPRYHQFLMTKYQWTTHHLNIVHWEIFQMAACTFPSTHTHLLKLVYDKLPTNHVRSWYDPTISAQCHFCHHPETFEPLCLSDCNPRSQEFQTNLVQALQDLFIKYDTPCTFQEIYMGAISSWMQRGDTSHLATRVSSHPALLAQQQISWQQMTRGFYAKQWQALLVQEHRIDQMEKWHDAQAAGTDNQQEGQDDYTISLDKAPQQTPRFPATPTQFLTKLIRTTWEALSQLWSNHLNHINDTDT